MGIIVNTNTMEEYNNKIKYYQMNGFKSVSSGSMNHQTRLTKKNFGPAWAHVILFMSLIASVLYLTELVIYPLAISDLFIRLNLFSLILAIRYLQYFGFLFIILFVIMLIVVLYYYLTNPYEVLVKLNPNNHQVMNNNIFNNQNRGNYYG